MPVLGAVELGGTKTLCAAGTGPGDIHREARIATSDPETTFAAVVDFMRSGHPVDAVGIAAFGPLELRVGHRSFGRLLATPKPLWSGADVLGSISNELEVPCVLDTDVNGAALGELRWGAARGLDTFVYVTVGTGVGGGALISGVVAHGLVHPEMGHVSVERLHGDDFPGVCPFHGDCLEGMVSGPALETRFGVRVEELVPGEHTEAPSIAAHYLASGFRNLIYTLAPQRIVVGGGVSSMPGLFPELRKRLAIALAGYPGLNEHHEEGFVVPAGLGERAGLLGAFVLSEWALTKS